MTLPHPDQIRILRQRLQTPEPCLHSNGIGILETGEVVKPRGNACNFYEAGRMAVASVLLKIKL